MVRRRHPRSSQRAIVREQALRIFGKLISGGAAGLLVSLQVAPAQAKDTKAIETAGTTVAIALPIAAGGISLLHHDDWDGIYELGASTALTVGSALILKQIVHERRPDHSDFQSFPSDTAAVAYSSADYLWGRYGWEYGVPAYAAAMFVGYSRVEAKQHHWYDVAASGALAFAFNYAVVTRYRRNDRYALYASADGDAIGLHFDARF
jgi:membrane-associated phospholipid phosphatase